MSQAFIVTMYNDKEAENKKVLDRGLHHISQDYNMMTIGPHTRVQLSDQEFLNGNVLAIDNKEADEIEVNLNDIIKSGSLKNILSINITSFGCGVEGFDGVKDSCHYICSSVNLQNIIIFIILCLVVYKLVYGQWSH